ncbi:hypothetical protein H257_03536 [Aphanomyces astaci]|uniref:Uncharacterized protein n=1 Tax=Aphanomyces astaci TaxID=112090 RepID=W4GZC9_APHAT|nr:hypothetical protein H257_03536 [Aphanomyces astaci]ETV84283.1 hypothetical protein H257_03536 [Aphanomyces astaci]|eukprot:XP_009825975.1 hypothetical protein H257_03536 [Aphanomyces astaci]
MRLIWKRAAVNLNDKLDPCSDVSPRIKRQIALLKQNGDHPISEGKAPLTLDGKLYLD